MGEHLTTTLIVALTERGFVQARSNEIPDSPPDSTFVTKTEENQFYAHFRNPQPGKRVAALMGFNTYKELKHYRDEGLPFREGEGMNVVLTNKSPDELQEYQPENNETVDFRHGTPKEILCGLENSGLTEVILLGGVSTYLQYLTAITFERIIVHRVIGTGDLTEGVELDLMPFVTKYRYNETRKIMSPESTNPRDLGIVLILYKRQNN